MRRQGTQQEPRSKRRSHLAFLGKVTVTGAILAVLLSRIDWKEFAAILAAAKPWWLLSAFLWQSQALVVSTLKWDGLLRDLEIRHNRYELLKLYVIGFFANAFLPGVVGGDVVRWYLAGTHSGGKRMKIAATILAERVTGALALAALCVAAVIRDPWRLAVWPILVLLTAFVALLLGALAVALSRKLAIVLRYRTRSRRSGPLTRRFHELNRTLRAFTSQALAYAVAWSLLFNVIGALTLYLLCVAFGLDITFLEAFAVRVLVNLFTLIPISLGGLGLNQAGDVFVLGILGIGTTQAFALSIVRQLINFGYQLVGAAFLLQTRLSSPTTLDESLETRPSTPPT